MATSGTLGMVLFGGRGNSGWEAGSIGGRGGTGMTWKRERNAKRQNTFKNRLLSKRQFALGLKNRRTFL